MFNLTANLNHKNDLANFFHTFFKFIFFALNAFKN